MTDRTLYGLLRTLQKRLTSVERRLAARGTMQRDTGWVDLSAYNNGTFTVAYLEGRRRGGVIEMRGSLTGTLTAGMAVTEFLSGLPAEWRPTRNARGSGYAAGFAVSVVVRPAGTGAVSNRIGTTVSNWQFSIMYFPG